MVGEGDPNGSEESGTEDYLCGDCAAPFKTAQGLAGHRRLAHSAAKRSDLEAKEASAAEREKAAERKSAEVARRAVAATRREVELSERERRIADTGPAALGMVQCPECSSWFENSGNLHRHARTIHPIEEKVAKEVGRSRQRVEEVWREAARKQEANPGKSTEWIVGQFWSGTDQKILQALLARNATFRRGGG